MRVIAAQNVHEALPVALGMIHAEGIRTTSRNGPVLRMPIPVTTAYMKPEQRVEVHAQRDANPWFHLMEAMWMLAGRNDVAFIQHFNSKIGQFSDDGEKFNGAYGHRWRKHFGVDQLTSVVRALRSDRTCRRQVITMFDARRDVGLDSKDIPCNTQIFPQISVDGCLDMLLMNRSNDLVWGAFGANAVHFSMLQEYLARSIGVPVGVLYQTTFNLHLYLERHEALLDLPVQPQTPTVYGQVNPQPLMTLPQNRWDRELQLLMVAGHTGPELTDPFLEGVVKPMWRAWDEWKVRGEDRYDRTFQALRLVIAHDWKAAGWAWVLRRQERTTNA